MTVQQYKGARYVPLFPEPDKRQWSNQYAYEALTVVLHQGNSYTSVQSVPIGVDITDERYWAATGNYNAQVEYYRQQTVELSKDVTKLSGTVDTVSKSLNSEVTRAKAAEKANADAVTAEATRAKAAEKVNADAVTAEATRAKAAESTLSNSVSSTNANIDKVATQAKKNVDLGYYISQGYTFNEAVNKALADNDNAVTTLVLPGGSYDISYVLDFGTKVKHVVGNGTVLTAARDMDFMVKIGTYGTVENVTLDGNSKAKDCIDMGQQSSLVDCVVKNPKSCCIGGTAQGLEVHHCRIYNSVTTNKLETTGIICGTDGRISDSWIWGHKVGINTKDNTSIDNSYFWNYYATFNCKGVYCAEGHILATNVTFDCINEPFDCRVISNNINVYLNSTDTAKNTNPYYKIAKDIKYQSIFDGYNAATDGVKEYTNGTGSQIVNIVSASLKNNGNWTQADFNLVNMTNYSTGINSVFGVDDTTNFYKLAEIKHTDVYQLTLLMWNRANTGCVLTITDNEIYANTGILHNAWFNSADSIRFNENNGTLTIYGKYNNPSTVGFKVIAASDGISSLNAIAYAEKSTISSYNRTFSA